MNNPCGPVPLLFITGFLGSGKTTLLNRILDEAAAHCLLYTSDAADE